MSCDELVEFLSKERKSLQDEIEKDKWYLSEKAGYDVGYEFAKNHFMSNLFYLNAWAEGYKTCYCILVCKNKCKEVKNENNI